MHSIDSSKDSDIINQNDVFRKVNGDPMYDAFGSAEDSNPVELAELKQQLQDLGVQIVQHQDDDAALAYQNTQLGEPGTVSVSPNASYSAWMHEARHAFDDADAGWNACYAVWDTEEHIRREKRAYEVEINLARSMGRDEIADILAENLQKEIDSIKRRDEMYAELFRTTGDG